MQKVKKLQKNAPERAAARESSRANGGHGGPGVSAEGLGWCPRPHSQVRAVSSTTRELLGAHSGSGVGDLDAVADAALVADIIAVPVVEADAVDDEVVEMEGVTEMIGEGVIVMELVGVLVTEYLVQE
jgi:hypothetical protein